MKMEEITYILAEMQNFDGISLPLRSTNRIKYSCFTASNNFLVFGATSGGIYVFKKDTCSFMYLLPNKEGTVTHIAVSPDEKWFGFATMKGLSCVLEHSIGAISRRIVSSEHEGTKVTALHWNPLSSQLFVGDELGRISVISTSSFLAPTVTLMQLDSQIVQLDCCSHLLLASTLTRCYLCDTFREQYRQIGTRARDGTFGGCFYCGSSLETSSKSETGLETSDTRGPYNSSFDGESLLADETLKHTKLFCTRPGLRLWEVHVDGTVIRTHQFKRLLETPPTGVIRPPPSEIPLLPQSYENYSSTQTFNFSTLHRLGSKFLFTFHRNGIYILDPVSGDVVLWTDAFMGIKDVSAVGHTLFVWMGDFVLHSVNILLLDQFLIQIYLQKQLSFCASVCASYFDVLLRQISSYYKLNVMTDLLDKLKENNVCVDDAVYSKVSHLLSQISENAHGQQCSQILNSGIFVVGNAHLLSQREAVKPLSSPKPKFPLLVPQRDFHEDRNEDSTGNHIIHMGNKDLFESNDCSEDPEIDDYDPFADLPLSALTSPETVAAFRQISNTVTETITNGTKSLKEKWHSIEEKIRASDSYQLSSLARGMNETDEKNSKLLPDERIKDAVSSSILCSIQKKSYNMFFVDITIFEDLCEKISSCDTASDKSREDLYAELLRTIAILFETYRKFMHNTSSRVSFDSNIYLAEDNMEEIMGNLLDSACNFSFPFKDYFSKDLILNLEKHFLSCLRTGALVHWLRKFLPIKASCSNLYPTFLLSVYREEDLILDQALGKFLLLSRFLLNPFVILESLNDSQAPCQYFSWNVVVDNFNSGPSSDSVGSDSGNWPIPCLLNAMLVVLQRGQTESCRNLGNHVPVKYVLRLMLKLDKQPHTLFKMFLSYVDKLPIQRLLDELKDVEVLYFIKLAFEKLKEGNHENQCECGFPLQSTKSSFTFNRIRFALLCHMWEANEKAAVFNICHWYGAWSQLLSLRRDESMETVLPLLLQSGCIGELKARHKDLSHSIWQQIFELQERLQDAVCLGCGKNFHGNTRHVSKNWSGLATFLIQQTDPKYAMNLITKFSRAIPSGSIDIRFYQSCLLATVAEKYRKGSKKPLLDLVLYSSELPCMSAELAEKIDYSFTTDPEHWQHHHWGLHLKMSESNCMCCLLPLSSPRLLQGWGITGFKCGHAFHSVCLVQSHIVNCPVCLSK